MKKLLTIFAFISLFNACDIGTAGAQTIYQFSPSYEVEKINGAWTPTVSLGIQYGFVQTLDSALWDLSSFEAAGFSHNFSNGGVVVNNIPLSVGLKVTPSANGLSYGAGVCYEAISTKVFPEVNIDFTVQSVTGLFSARLTPEKKRKHGLKIIL